ncbi:MAG: DNA-directed RNA polymerase subunit beta', partial [Proteobacteria bacterium]|nr:DNA-directed RNA polymerase subunit beta' [Pseudomonadota bacterium]
VAPLCDRVLGRVVAENVFKRGVEEPIVKSGTLLDEEWVEYLEQEGVDRINVRSPITCESKYGICAKCYGRDLGRGQIVNLGEAVGVVAAQSIGEPGTQLTMRTFHIGGAASRAAAVSQIEVKSKGTTKFDNLKLLPQQADDGTIRHIAVSRSGEVSILDEFGLERERYKVPYGAVLNVQEGEDIAIGQMVASWDPHTFPIITEVAGKTQFADVIEGITVSREVDEMTGLSSIVVMEPKLRPSHAKDMRPTVKLVDEKGENVNIVGTEMPATYTLPPRAVINVEDGAWVKVGDIVARLQQESTKTRDITGGLPRVADLFEARIPKEPAILAEQTGIITFGKDTRTKQKILIAAPDSNVEEIPISKWRHINVYEGQHVEKGEEIVEGPPNPHDILRLLGVSALADYIVNEVQEVYRLQGVKINDKHIEVIVRQMLRKVVILEHGDTRLL